MGIPREPKKKRKKKRKKEPPRLNSDGIFVVGGEDEIAPRMWPSTEPGDAGVERYLSKEWQFPDADVEDISEFPADGNAFDAFGGNRGMGTIHLKRLQDQQADEL